MNRQEGEATLMKAQRWESRVMGKPDAGGILGDCPARSPWWEKATAPEPVGHALGGYYHSSCSSGSRLGYGVPCTASSPSCQRIWTSIYSTLPRALRSECVSCYARPPHSRGCASYVDPYARPRAPPSSWRIDSRGRSSFGVG